MTHKTLVLSSIEKYLACDEDSRVARMDQNRERDERLCRFPYPVMLQLAYPEADNAIRWCWEHFGPMNGECFQKYSEYRVCFEVAPHCHTGTWTSHWFVKTEYNFGFLEVYFAQKADWNLFLANLNQINWGENYSK